MKRKQLNWLKELSKLLNGEAGRSSGPAAYPHLQSQRDCVLQSSNGVARNELPWENFGIFPFGVAQILCWFLHVALFFCRQTMGPPLAVGSRSARRAPAPGRVLF